MINLVGQVIDIYALDSGKREIEDVRVCVVFLVGERTYRLGVKNFFHVTLGVKIFPALKVSRF